MLSQKIHNLLNEVKFTEWNKYLSKFKILDHFIWNHYTIFSRKKSHIPPLDDPNKNNPEHDTSKDNLLVDTSQKVYLDSYHSVSSHEEATVKTLDKIQNSSP